MSLYIRKGLLDPTIVGENILVKGEPQGFINGINHDTLNHEGIPGIPTGDITRIEKTLADFMLKQTRINWTNALNNTQDLSYVHANGIHFFNESNLDVNKTTMDIDYLRGIANLGYAAQLGVGSSGTGVTESFYGEQFYIDGDIVGLNKQLTINIVGNGSSQKTNGYLHINCNSTLDSSTVRSTHKQDKTYESRIGFGDFTINSGDISFRVMNKTNFEPTGKTTIDDNTKVLVGFNSDGTITIGFYDLTHTLYYWDIDTEGFVNTSGTKPVWLPSTAYLLNIIKTEDTYIIKLGDLTVDFPLSLVRYNTIENTNEEDRILCGICDNDISKGSFKIDTITLDLADSLIGYEKKGKYGNGIELKKFNYNFNKNVVLSDGGGSQTVTKHQLQELTDGNKTLGGVLVNKGYSVVVDSKLNYTELIDEVRVYMQNTSASVVAQYEERSLGFESLTQVSNDNGVYIFALNGGSFKADRLRVMVSNSSAHDIGFYEFEVIQGGKLRIQSNGSVRDEGSLFNNISGHTYLDYSLRINKDGVIKDWSVRTKRQCNLKFKIFRPEGSNFLYIGETLSVNCTDGGVYHFKNLESITVKAGDIIGVLSDQNDSLSYEIIDRDSIRSRGSDVTVTLPKEDYGFSGVNGTLQIKCSGVGFEENNFYVVARGEKLGNLNYKNIDLNQGTIRVWVDRKVLNLSGDKYIFAIQGSTGTINANRLHLKINDSRMLEFRIVDSSGVPKYVVQNLANVTSNNIHIEATWDLDGSVVEGNIYKINLFVNGSDLTTQYGNAPITNINMIEVGNKIYIGSNGYNLGGEQYKNAISGLLDDFEISNNVRHFSSFVPPTAGLISDNNTKLLAGFDEGDGVKIVQGVNSEEIKDESGNLNYLIVNNETLKELPDYQKKETVLFKRFDRGYYVWMEPNHPVYNKPLSDSDVLPDTISVYRHGERLINDSWENVIGVNRVNRTCAMSSTGEIATAYQGQTQWDTIQVDYKVGLDTVKPVYAGLSSDGSYLYSAAGLKDIANTRPTAYIKHSPFYGEVLRNGLNSNTGLYPGLDISWDKDNSILWGLVLEGSTLNNRICSIDKDSMDYDESFYINIEARYPKSVYEVIRGLAYITSNQNQVTFDVVIQEKVAPYKKFIKTVQTAQANITVRVVNEINSLEITNLFENKYWDINTNCPMYYDGVKYLYIAQGSEIFKLDRTQGYSLVEISDTKKINSKNIKIKGLHKDHNEYFWILDGNSMRVMKVNLNAISGEGTTAFSAAYGEIHSTLLTEDICKLEEPTTQDNINFYLKNTPVFSFTRMIIDGQIVAKGDVWSWNIDLETGKITFTQFAYGESDMSNHTVRVDYVSKITKAIVYPDLGTVSQSHKIDYYLSNDGGTTFEKVVPNVEYNFINKDNHELMLKTIIADNSSLIVKSLLNNWSALSTPNIYRTVPTNRCCSQLSEDGNEHKLELNSVEYTYVSSVDMLSSDNQYTVVDGVVYIYHSNGAPSETEYQFTYYTERNNQLDVKGLLVLST